MTSAPWNPAIASESSEPGPLRFGDWFTESDELHVVRVIGESFVRGVFGAHGSQGVLGQERRQLQQLVTDARLRHAARIDVRQSDDVSAALRDAAGPSEPLILGRRARSRAQAMVRLGPVARRVLRAAQGPVIMVPPALERVGAGPVLLATACGGSEEAAVIRFARDVAAHKRRPLLAVHAFDLPDPEYRSGFALSTPALGHLERERRERAERRLALWADENGFSHADTRLLQGDELESIVSLAESLDAALVVSAAPPRGPWEVMSGPSFSSDLASHAGCAVALIPALPSAAQARA